MRALLLSLLIFSIAFTQDAELIKQSKLVYYTICDKEGSNPIKRQEQYYLNSVYSQEGDTYFIVYTSGSRKTTVEINQSYDLIQATFEVKNQAPIVVTKENDVLSYIQKNRTNYVKSKLRTVIFPEIQLRDYYATSNTSPFPFEYLRSVHEPPSQAHAANTFDASKNRVHGALIELHGISKREWALEYLFVDLFVVEKVGRFPIEDTVLSSTLIGKD